MLESEGYFEDFLKVKWKATIRFFFGFDETKKIKISLNFRIFEVKIRIIEAEVCIFGTKVCFFEAKFRISEAKVCIIEAKLASLNQKLELTTYYH